MTVRLRDPSILVVDEKFRLLVLADRATPIHGIGFEIKVTGGAIRAAAFHVPAALRRWNYMDRFSRHLFLRLR